MPMTAATLTAASTGMRKVFQLMSTATTDGTGALSLTIAHGFGAAQRISVASDATNRISCFIDAVLPSGGVSGWYTVSRDATNLIVSKQVNAIASSDAAVQANLVAQVVHSLVE